MYYKNSSTFGILKVTKETIETNYSSNQYIQVLDTCLYKAIEPILYCSDYVDGYIGSLMFWYMKETHKNITPLTKEDFAVVCFAFLQSTNAEDKLKCLYRLRLDRSLLINCVQEFLNTTDKSTFYVGNPNLKTRVTTKRDIEPCYAESLFWHNLSIEFKNQIKEKYTRLVIMEAKGQYVQSNHRLDLDDLCQEYLLYLDKAICKYDVTKGTLTSYIQTWTNKVKNLIWIRLNNVEYSYDSIIETTDIKSEENIESQICSVDYNLKTEALIASVDPQGLGRALLGL